MTIKASTLLRRQTRRGWWIYLVIMISYFVYILLDHDDFERTASWKLLLPIVPLIFQICCPTLAGWIIVLVPVTCYVIFLSYAFCYGLVTHDFEISGIIAGDLVMAGLAFL